MLSFISRDNVSGGARAPVLISHQRQLSLSVSQVSCQAWITITDQSQIRVRMYFEYLMFQVQERLIKNKTLFTAVEPVISSTSLQVRHQPIRGLGGSQ